MGSIANKERTGNESRHILQKESMLGPEELIIVLTLIQDTNHDVAFEVKCHRPLEKDQRRRNTSKEYASYATAKSVYNETVAKALAGQTSF